MPVPKPPMSDGEMQARMSSALMAWRRIAAGIHASRGREENLKPAFGITRARDAHTDNDLETIAHAFDAWPSAVAHIQDLRAEIERLEFTRTDVALAARTVVESGPPECSWCHDPLAAKGVPVPRQGSRALYCSQDCHDHATCQACKDATGGVCRAHQEPECTCYELTGGHMPGCAFNLVSPYKQCGSDGCPFVAKNGGAYCSTHEAHPEWREP